MQEAGVDLWPQLRGAALGNGESRGQRRQRQNTSATPDTKLTGFSVAPVVAIYVDQTGEATDDHAYMDIVNVRTAMAVGLRASYNILDQALKTDLSAHPSVTAVKAFDQAMLAARMAGHNPTENEYLKGERDAIANAATLAADQNTTERDFLEQEKARLQKEADLMTAYAEVRRLP